MKKIFLLAFVVGLLSACDATAKVDNSTVQSVDLNRYLGYWYEIAKYDHYFERDLDYAMAHYSVRDDGKIDVLNTGIKNGRAEDAKDNSSTRFAACIILWTILQRLSNHDARCRLSVCFSWWQQRKVLMDIVAYATIG